MAKHRFALNDTENGYAGAYRTWPDWERTLDILALHGFTEILVAAGQDEVYRRTFAEFGYLPTNSTPGFPPRPTSRGGCWGTSRTSAPPKSPRSARQASRSCASR